MKILIILITLVIANNAQSGFEPPVIIEPINPVVGDNIRIGVFKDHYPPCLSLPEFNIFGDSHSVVLTNNQIDLTVVTETSPICIPAPIIPAPREYYDIGYLAEGSYTLNTYYVDIITAVPPLGVTPFVYGPSLNFEVKDVIHPVPILSLYWKIFLVFSIFILIIFINKKELT